MLLGEIVERTTGRRSGARSADCSGSGSSGLTRTYLESLEARPRAAHPRAHQHYQRIDATGFDPSFDLYGGGGLVSSVGDLARFYRALLYGQVYEKRATLRTMLGKHRYGRPARTRSSNGRGLIKGESSFRHPQVRCRSRCRAARPAALARAEYLTVGRDGCM